VLTFINLFNYMDRYVLAALVEPLGAELQLSDTQLGWLMPGFIIVYMLFSPIFGTLGDRGNRTKLIALGVLIWSVATATAGLAAGFVSLFLARAMVGVGEAAYGTIAPAILADYFRPRIRGRIFAVFFCAIPIGSALGYMLGGFVAAAHGWRMAFFVAGLPGLLLAGLVLGLKDPPRGRYDPPEAPDRPRSTIFQTYGSLLKNRAYMLTVVGYGAYTFALGGLAFWGPTFLVRARGVPSESAAMQFGSIVVVTGFVGTAAGGWLADKLLARTRQANLWLCGVSTLLAAPCVWVAITAEDSAVYLVSLVLAELLLFASSGPINSAIVDLVSPSVRASALALSILCMHLLGDVPSPPLIGMVSDMSSLAEAFRMIPIAVVVGGVIWCWAAVEQRKAHLAQAGIQ